MLALRQREQSIRRSFDCKGIDFSRLIRVNGLATAVKQLEYHIPIQEADLRALPFAMRRRSLQMRRGNLLFSVSVQRGELVGPGANRREIEGVNGEFAHRLAAQRVLG